LELFQSPFGLRADVSDILFEQTPPDPKGFTIEDFERLETYRDGNGTAFASREERMAEFMTCDSQGRMPMSNIKPGDPKKGENYTVPLEERITQVNTLGKKRVCHYRHVTTVQFFERARVQALLEGFVVDEWGPLVNRPDESKPGLVLTYDNKIVRKLDTHPDFAKGFNKMTDKGVLSAFKVETTVEWHARSGDQPESVRITFLSADSDEPLEKEWERQGDKWIPKVPW
jgi:hypothetical protein